MANNMRCTRSSTKTIDAIVEAAAYEFAQFGLHGGRVDRIAKRAEITSQLVYHYFTNKTNLYTAVIEHLGKLISTSSFNRDYTEFSPKNAFQQLMRDIFDLHDRIPYLAKYTLEQNLYHGKHISFRNEAHRYTSSYTQIIKNILDRGLISGDFRENIDNNFFIFTANTLLLACFTEVTAFDMFAHANVNDTLIRQKWREYAIDFLLKSILAPTRGFGSTACEMGSSVHSSTGDEHMHRGKDSKYERHYGRGKPSSHTE